MKYSKSESAYFRKSKKENSIKGGKLRENGVLEKSDFSGKNGNNVVPKQKFNVEKNSNMGVELKNMNPTNVGRYKPTNSVKPIKIMKQQLTGEPFLFFGYNPQTDKYNLVCYNNFSSINPIKCNKLVIHANDSSEIVELSHAKFLIIPIEDLIVLCYHFLKIRQKNRGFMDTLYKYLSDFVFEKVFGTQFSNSNNDKMYKDMVEEIGGMVSSERSRMLNKQNGGKLDIDGKLDSNDFDIESKNPNGSGDIEMNNYQNASLHQNVIKSNISTTITVQQNFQNQTVLPKGNDNTRSITAQPNNQNQTVLPKEIIKKGFPFTNEPYIFFGYNREMEKYRYVCYNHVVGNPVFRKLEDNKETISQKLTLDQIRKIGNPILLELFCFLNRKTINRGDGVLYMERLQTYLTQYAGVKISKPGYC